MQKLSAFTGLWSYRGLDQGISSTFRVWPHSGEGRINEQTPIRKLNSPLWKLKTSRFRNEKMNGNTMTSLLRITVYRDSCRDRFPHSVPPSRSEFVWA